MAHAANLSDAAHLRWDELLSGEPGEAARTIEAHLDRMTGAERVAWLRRARSEHLQSLFELCRDRPLRAEHLVPSLRGGLPEGNLQAPAEALHDGVNSLLLFRVFQKRFFRAADGTLAGYNPGPFNWATTPGYFVVREDEGGLFFDYTELPRDVPAGWPRPIPNQRRLGRFVYHGLRDDMRRVSEHVCIGAVSRHGQPIDTWFALCRRE